MDQDREPRTPRPGASSKRKPGRPAGSASLTKEVHEMIVGYVRGGCFDHVAAEAAGISARTFREWIARGEGRSARPTTDKHKRFAADVKRARAEARLGAEVRVYRDRPTYWLSRVARTTEDAMGWSDPAASAKEGSQAFYMKRLEKFTDDELREQINRLLEDDGPPRPHHSPPCPHPRCRCPWHKTVRA